MSVKYRFLLVFLKDEKLYKRKISTPLLKYLDKEEVSTRIKEVHQGICGNHSGGRSLSHKLLKQGYYWPTMQSDAQGFVKTCSK